MISMTPHQVEQKYGVSVAELARWRRAGIGPEYFRPAARPIRYDVGDVDDWFNDPANAHLHDFPVKELDDLCLV